MLEHLKRFFSRHVWSLSLASLSVLAFMRLAHEIATGQPAPFDHAISHWIQARRGRWDAAMSALTWLGSWRPLLVLCCAVVVLLLALRKTRESIYLILCASGAVVACDTLKLVFHRARPDLALRYLIAMPESFSFPSGHAMASMGVIGTLVIVVFVQRPPLTLRVFAAGVGLALVMGVAASRVYFGVHYPSDVIAGQLGGAAWIALVTGWFYPRLLPGEKSGAA